MRVKGVEREAVEEMTSSDKLQLIYVLRILGYNKVMMNFFFFHISTSSQIGRCFVFFLFNQSWMWSLGVNNKCCL